MKKFILCLCAVTLALSVTAQTHRNEKKKKAINLQFYGKIGLGAAFQHAGESLSGEGLPYSGSIGNTDTGTYVNYTSHKVSFSAGVQAVITGGVLFTKNIGFELTGDFGLSPKKYSTTIYNVSVNGVPSNVTETNYAKRPIFLLPSLVLQTGGEKLNVYARFGVALPLNSKIINEQSSINLPNTGATSLEVDTWEYKNRFGLGFSGAAGVQYYLFPALSLWAEANVLSMSLYTEQATLTSVTLNNSSSVNGQPIMSLISADQKLIHYEFNLNSMDRQHQPAYAIPFSNVGLLVGLSYKF